jgi:hypothetical protein
MDELDAALESWDRIARMVADGEGAFDASADRQFALIFLWVNVGSLPWQTCANDAPTLRVLLSDLRAAEA